MTKPWMLDELGFAGEEHLDSDYVSGYDRKAQFDPSADIAELVRYGLTSSSRVIDFGAGSGTFALAIARGCQSVIAVDPSPAMNAYLRNAAAQAGISNLSVVNGGFLSYTHAAEPVDFIYTRNALHHLPDFWKVLALSKLRALLKPNGILRLHDLIFDFGPTDIDARIEAWLAGAVDDAAKGWTADELAEHVRREHSTFSWLFEPMLQRTGFEIVGRQYRRGVYGAYTCRAASQPT